ncbi:hypothetical protein GCM10009837_07320 [Streptomyces durmitorensis]|uniref:Uncharacterized protein n=1 Tax=Streptomyces durmitorensis TaxID=319947 RepID=A0ABY4PKY4_9ACTN|nr:hypothetical protein [Streptomyces durmitorensis]UQT54376.1 hypothetical protein M4V62_04335 [Streptomyces durmitorensis]
MPGSYTAREKWEIAKISAKTLKQAAASDGPHGTTDIVDPRLGNRLETIRQRGEERYEREASAVFQKLEQAENAVAKAKADLKTAPDSRTKATARQALQKAKSDLSKADRAARKY